MMPDRIQLRRTKGWRKPEGAVVVARPTKWGNPYRVGIHGDAARCVALYRQAATGLIDNTRPPVPQVTEVMAMQDHLRTHLPELRGKDLACWCPLDAPCHADVLLELANTPDFLKPRRLPCGS